MNLAPSSLRSKLDIYFPFPFIEEAYYRIIALLSNSSFLKDSQFLRDLLYTVHRHVEVDQPPSLHVEYNSVHSQLLPIHPGLLDEGSACDIEHLFFDVDFNKKLSFFIKSLQMGECVRVLMSYSPQPG